MREDMHYGMERPKESRRTRLAYAGAFFLCVAVGVTGLVALILAGAPSDPSPGQGRDLGVLRLISMLVSVVCLTLATVGARMLVRKWRRRRARLVFVVPPSWPSLPDGWAPPEGWQPSPEWPEPPPGWRFWGER